MVELFINFSLWGAWKNIKMDWDGKLLDQWGETSFAFTSSQFKSLLVELVAWQTRGIYRWDLSGKALLYCIYNKSMALPTWPFTSGNMVEWNISNMCIHSRAGTAEQLESSVRQEGNNLSLNSRAAALLPDVYKLLLKRGNATTFAATGSCCCRFSVISLPVFYVNKIWVYVIHLFFFTSYTMTQRFWKKWDRLHFSC